MRANTTYMEINTLPENFASYLKAKKLTPKGFFIHYPIDNRDQFYENLRKEDKLDTFCTQYRHSIRKDVIVATPLLLSIASCFWQLAAEISNPGDLLIYSINTGGFAAFAFIIANSFLLARQPRAAILISGVSKLFPIWLVDGLWQFLWEAADDPKLHALYYRLAACLYVIAQTTWSFLIKSYLAACHNPALKQHVPGATLGIIGTLTWSYWGFGYLFPYFQALGEIPAAWFSVFIPALIRGLILDLPLAEYNIYRLKKLHAEFFSSPQLLLNSYEESAPPKKTRCATLSSYLTYPFRYCCNLWKTCKKPIVADDSYNALMLQ